MLQATGPYHPCPCGSGKKFKLCCYKPGKANARSLAATRRENSASSPKRKMSEMISELGAGFLWVGDTMERQNRLNAACTAWNMACALPEVRHYQLAKYGESYLQFHHSTAPADLANVVKVMEAMVERKLNMFPDDKRQIVSAQVVKMGETFRIEIASLRL